MDILLVDDNPGDVLLTREALHGAIGERTVGVARAGVEAMELLKRLDRLIDPTSPELIFLDLNMPRKNGFEVLAELKADSNLRRIPVVVLTSSESEMDVLKVHELGGNCCVSKPVSFDETIEVVQAVARFWLNVVNLPPRLL